MKKYRELTPEERWEITDNLTPQDIMNGAVDHYLNDNVFWREVDYEHPDLVSFLDNRYAIINKEYGLEKLHKLSQYPRKKWEQSIAWYNHENNQNINENKNMKQNKIKITENELKQIVAESVKKILNENISENYWDEINRLLTNLYGWTQFYEEEFDKANIKDNGGRYSMRGALSEMQNIIGRLSDLCNDGRKMGVHRINESRKKREPRKGTIELNGKHIDAVEDGLDKYGNPMYKVNDPSIKGRRCKDGSIRVQHYNFKPNRVNEGSDVLNEIGDTLKGQFALGAVRGRASARPRYQNNKYGGLHTKSQQDNIANNAADASWENRKDLDINKSREMNNAEQRGYYYGFEKGMTN